MSLYKLYVFSADGESQEEATFESVKAAEDHSCDMGSRWIFYPIHVVATVKGTIKSVGNNMLEHYVGRKLKTLRKELEAGSVDLSFL